MLTPPGQYNIPATHVILGCMTLTHCLLVLRHAALMSEPEIDPKAEAARFTHPISSVTAPDGKTVRLEAVVAGHPQPQVVWFREGRQITTSQQYQVSMLRKFLFSLLYILRLRRRNFSRGYQTGWPIEVSVRLRILGDQGDSDLVKLKQGLNNLYLSPSQPLCIIRLWQGLVGSVSG